METNDNRYGYWQHLLSLAGEVKDNALSDIDSLKKWRVEHSPRHREFMRTFGLDPMPEFADLNIKSHGEFQGDGYSANKISYDILVNCRATGHLYIPKAKSKAERNGRLPAILYLSGHERVGTHGYSEHPAMFARRGYVCLIIDSLEQNDNHARHKGIYTGERLDYISRGYTPATAELLNAIRGIDVLESIPEVDPERIGATGISGGGSYCFFLACADERVKALATVAGLQGIYENVANRHFTHACDCSFGLNIHRRDIGEFAALIAPRPALYCYAVDDSLYSRDGYSSICDQARRVYELEDIGDKLRLFEYRGPHAYQPETIEEVNNWFDVNLAGIELPQDTLDSFKTDAAADFTTEFPESKLTILNGETPEIDWLPALPELMTRRGSFSLPHSIDEWNDIKNAALKKIKENLFPFLRQDTEKLKLEPVGRWLAGNDVDYHIYRGSKRDMELWLEFWKPKKNRGTLVLGVAGEAQSVPDIHSALGSRLAENSVGALETRGFGMTAPHPMNKRFLRRAEISVGTTITYMQMTDILSALKAIRNRKLSEERRIILYGRGGTAGAVLYAALLDDSIDAVVLEDLPNSHLKGAYLIDVLATLDIEHALGLMAPRPVALVNFEKQRSIWAERAYSRIGSETRLTFHASLAKALESVI